MKHLSHTGCLFLLLLVAQFTTAEEVTLYEATYKGEFSGWNISLDRTLIKRDDTYEFRSQAKNLFASITEQSIFELNDGRVQPNYYEYKRSVFGRKTVESLRFDWENHSAVYDRSDRPKNRTVHELTGPTLDPALYQLHLQADLANDKSELTYSFLKRKKRKQYEFTLQSEESLKLGSDTFKAVVISYTDDDKSTKVWVLVEHGYVLGKIVHRDEDDTYALELAELKFNNELLTELYSRMVSGSPSKPNPSAQPAAQKQD